MAPDSMTAEWRDRGLYLVRDLLDPDSRSYLATLDVESSALRQRNERKQLWTVDPVIRRLATGESTRACLDCFFDGGGYYLWGAQLIDREPGQAHPWHSDIETYQEHDGFVSLWIAVSGVSPRNSLRVVPGSHQYGVPLQAFFAWDDPARLDPEAVSILERARTRDPRAELHAVDCRDGDAIFFNGCLWHGSLNGETHARRALLLQYGRHEAAIRLAKDRTVYPPLRDEDSLPPVLPLRGVGNPLINHNIFQQGDQLGYPNAELAARPDLVNPEERPWVRFPYFKICSQIFEVMICHASELLPGCMPHMPHGHDLEELLMILDGTATIFSHQPNAGVLRSFAAGPGDLFYHPRQHPHSIYNGSDRPIHYLMLRWKCRAAAATDASPLHFRHSEYAYATDRFSVNRPSSGLAHLHIHFSRLQPGQGFSSHIDHYDTAIVVLQGTLSMLTHELGPGGVFYIRAGELHNTRNEGGEVCEYIVFEFHARTVLNAPPEEPRPNAC